MGKAAASNVGNLFPNFEDVAVYHLVLGKSVSRIVVGQEVPCRHPAI